MTRDLSCRTCAYQLRGLSALGRCPECGAEVMTSVVIAADPELRDLASVRAPARVASALLMTVTCMAAAVIVQLAGPATALIQELTDRPGPLGARLLGASWWTAALLLLAGAIASIGIAPRSEALLRAEWGRRRVALTLGLLLWAIAVAALPTAFGWRSGRYPDAFVLIITTAWQVLASLAPLTGLRHLLSILGRRSRRWREARQGRQSVDALVAAAGGVLVFSTAVPIMVSFRFDRLHTLALLLAVASAAVLVLGFLYLIMNAWWIARSSVRTVESIEAFIDGAGTAPPDAPRSH